MNKAWWKEAVVYQIYPRSFQDSNGDGVGDLQGIIARLDYLQALGVNVLWICPVYPSPNADNGYDISDYQGVAAEYGTMEDFDQLLEEAHNRSIRIIMDLVVNHTSDEHPWFIESRSSKDNSKRDWYIWADGKNGAEPNNWESIFSGSAWAYDGKTNQYFLHLFDKRQPDLNWENPEVREAVYEMVNWWCDKGIDGFRIDAITHIKKRKGLPDLPNPDNKPYVDSHTMHLNQPGILEHLRTLRDKTFRNYDIMTVGEANGVTPSDAADWVGEEDGIFNMIFQFEQLEQSWKNEDGTVNAVGFKKMLSKWQQALNGIGWNALYLENHDIPRIVSTLGDDKKYWEESTKMLATMYFFLQGTPYIYQGQEIGMTNVQYPSIDDYDDVRMKNLYAFEVANGKDPDEILSFIWENGRDNARTPMQWNREENAGFTTGKPWLKTNENVRQINVEKQIADENSVLRYYQKMIQLRRNYPLFIYGDYQLLLKDEPHTFIYTRSFEGKRACIVTNMTADTVKVHLAERVLNGHQLIANYPDGLQVESGTIHLRPYEAGVILYDGEESI